MRPRVSSEEVLYETTSNDVDALGDVYGWRMLVHDAIARGINA
jgi:hypothetical protein